MRFKAILFDLDYTLFDSETSEQEALAITLTTNGIDPIESTIDRYRAINRSLWKSLEREELTLARLRLKRFEELVNHLRIEADPTVLADMYTRNLGLCGEFYPQAKKILKSIGTRTKLGLVTNGVSETQRSRLNKHDFAKYFDAIVVSGEFGIAKPNPAIFLEMMRLLDLESGPSVLMVGDSLTSDIAGANLSGLSACWFNPAGNTAPNDMTIDYDIRSLDELNKIL